MGYCVHAVYISVSGGAKGGGSVGCVRLLAPLPFPFPSALPTMTIRSPLASARRENVENSVLRAAGICFNFFSLFPTPNVLDFICNYRYFRFAPKTRAGPYTNFFFFPCLFSICPFVVRRPLHGDSCKHRVFVQSLEVIARPYSI